MDHGQTDREAVLARCYPRLTPEEREEAVAVLRRYLQLCMRLYDEEESRRHPHRAVDEPG